MTTKEDLFHRLKYLAEQVRTLPFPEMEGPRNEIEDALSAWFCLQEAPLRVIFAYYDEDARGQVAVEVEGGGYDEDEDEYLAALQELLEGHIEVRKLEQTAMTGTLSITASPGVSALLATFSEPFAVAMADGRVCVGEPVYNPTTGQWLMETALHVDKTTPPSGALGAYGVPKKGKKGMPARW